MEESETAEHALDDLLNFADDWDLDGLPIYPSSSAPFALQHNQHVDEAPDENHDLARDDFPHCVDDEPPETSRPTDLGYPRAAQQPTSQRSGSFQGSAKAPRKKYTRSPRKPGGYECEECKEDDYIRKFNTDAELRKHRQQVHTPKCERPLGCAICDKRFHFQKDLTRHWKTHSGFDNPSTAQQTASMSEITLPLDPQPASQACASSASQTLLDAEDLVLPSAKRHRRDPSSSDKSPKVPTARSSESSDVPQQEATYTEKHRHHSRKAFFATANRELRTFVDMQSSEITITATIDKCTETIKIVARHEVHALHEKHPDSDFRTTPTPSRPKRARERVQKRSDRGSSDEVLA